MQKLTQLYVSAKICNRVANTRLFFYSEIARKEVEMSRREVPVVLITGYLGSGKTTLMQHLLMQEERKVALIVNDMGSINIDASLLSRTNNQVAQVEMVEM